MFKFHCVALFKQKSFPFSSLGSFFILFLIFPYCESAKADTIAFLYAIESDLVSLREKADDRGHSVMSGTTSIAVLKLNGNTIYAAKMGAGCVKTAVTTQAVLSKFRCDYVITTGPVGALSDKWKIGQWGTVNLITAYQRGTETPDGFQLAAEATIPIAPLLHHVWYPDEIPASSLMHVASGEVFCASELSRNQLASRTGADVIDMNLFGLMVVCQAYKVPVVAWRIVSDNANESAARDFSDFIKTYDGVGGKWVADWVRKLPPNPSNPENYEI